MTTKSKEISLLISARGRIKDSSTRLENLVYDLKLKNDILIRMHKLDELYKEFDKLDSELEESHSEIDEFERRYFTLKAKYQDKLDALSLHRISNTGRENSSIVDDRVQSNANFRLPKLNIPIFSGNFQDWINFKDLYTSLVHSQSSLSNIQKFQYLKGLLSDEPLSLIKHIPLSNESYEEAWNKLNERYDKKKQIVYSLISTFLEQKAVSSANLNNLRGLVDTSDEITRGLKALGEEATSRDPWLIHLLLRKLDSETKRLWSVKTAEIEFPTWEQFLEFLNVRCSSLDLINFDSEVKTQTKVNYVSAKNIPTSKSDKLCLKCSGTHKLYRCLKFKSMDLNARKAFVKRNYLCFLCLNAHKWKDCPNNHLKCSVCQGKHNFLLHEEIKGNNASVSNSGALSKQLKNDDRGSNISQTEPILDHEVPPNTQKINSSTSVHNSKQVSFLPTAKVLLYNNEGKSFSFRALLDSGSECSFISENVVNVLGLKRKNDRVCLNGIAGVSAGTTRGSVYLKIGSRFSEEFIFINAYILNKVTSKIPLEQFNIQELDYLKNISLADDNFARPAECDIILGSDCFFTILRNARIVGSQGQPIAQSTIFGWVVAGQIQNNYNISSITQSHVICMESENNIDSVLQKFWQTEELSVKKSFLSEEEEFCENHFKSTYKFNDEGRFVVRLPIYKDVNELGDTKRMAVSRLLAMETKFKFDHKLERDYKAFMLEYEELKHMSIVKDRNSSKFEYFLPHHAVRKSDSISTKLRVVFDGSCKSPNSHSLNYILGIGQILQPDIFTILIRFRLKEFAFTADIQQMYRQILVDPEDQDLQRIVWRNSSNSDIKEYKLCTVTYGTSSAPFLATRCLHQIGLDCEEEKPEIANIIKNSFYMDDLMTTATSKQEAISIIKELTEVLDAKGFHLRKWRSNCPEILSDLSERSEANGPNLEIHPENCSKSLGDITRGVFIFNVNLKFKNQITK